MEYKERHVYFFRCKECGKSKRSSFKRRIARAKRCRTCRSVRPNENQQRLFDLPPVETNNQNQTPKPYEQPTT
jgi:hypothetical protein